MPRFYQVSLRTIFELMFVAAVVFAFIYWRAQPPPEPAGRYQLSVTGNQYGGADRAVILDTKTGKAWRGRIGSNQWDSIPTPADPFTPAPAPPATPATAAVKAMSPAARWSGRITGESSGSDSVASPTTTRRGCY